MSEMVAIPGDPSTLAKYASTYQRIATQLINASNDLRAVANDGVFVSLAINEIRNDADQASHDARSIYLRYTGTADALATYSTKLQDAQDRADRAIRANVSADVEVFDLTERRELYEKYAKEPGPDQEDWVRRLAVVEDDLSAAQMRSQNSWHEYNAAIEDRDRAASEAIEQIRLAADASRLNDTIWDDIVGVSRAVYLWAQTYVAPILEQLRPLIESLADILSVLAFVALLLSFIPGMAAVAGFLSLAALAMSALALLMTAILFVLGRETLGNLIGSTIKFAVSAVMHFVGGSAVSGALLGRAPFISANASKLYVKILGEAIEEGSGALVDEAAEHFVDQGVSAVGGIGESKVVLFESSSSGDWNPPPTIQVENFTMPETIGDIEGSVQPVLEGSVSVCR